MSFVISLRGTLPRPFTIICPRYRAPGRLVFPGGAPNGYSRESTPESGGSHYMDHYRDVNGKHYDSIIFSIYYHCLYKYCRSLFFEHTMNPPSKNLISRLCIIAYCIKSNSVTALISFNCSMVTQICLCSGFKNI